MKQILLALCILITFNISGQEKEKGRFFKSIYDELFKYSTLYIAGDVKNAKENAPVYFVRTNPNGSLYDVPVVVDGTPEFEYDYRYGFGIRKIARFDYELKGK